MAVCRKARVVKLVLAFALTFGLLYKAFPDQVHDFLANFAPPNLDNDSKESQVSFMLGVLT